MKKFLKTLKTVVKVSYTCIIFKISVITRYVFDVNFDRKLNVTEFPARKSFRSFFVAFWATK
jgi:hypothetical protein